MHIFDPSNAIAKLGSRDRMQTQVEICFAFATLCPLSSSLLHEQVYVIDPHRVQLTVRSLDIAQQSPKAYENMNIISLALLEPVDLPMTNVVVLVSERLLVTHLPPTLCIVFATVQVQCQSKSDLHSVSYSDWVELGIQVEHEHGALVFAVGGDARDAVIFLVVEGIDREGGLVEDGFGHGDDESEFTKLQSDNELVEILEAVYRERVCPVDVVEDAHSKNYFLAPGTTQILILGFK
jgi:hypothetical protein